MSGFFGHFAMQTVNLPLKLIRDIRLSPLDRSVYAELLANVTAGPEVSIGHRLIAERIGVDADTIGRALRSLAVYGYLSIMAGGAGKRSRYRILSVDGVEVVAKAKPLHEIKSLPRHVDPESVAPYFCSRELVERWKTAQMI